MYYFLSVPVCASGWRVWLTASSGVCNVRPLAFMQTTLAESPSQEASGKTMSSLSVPKCWTFILCVGGCEPRTEGARRSAVSGWFCCSHILIDAASNSWHLVSIWFLVKSGPLNKVTWGFDKSDKGRLKKMGGLSKEIFLHHFWSCILTLLTY